MHQAVRAVHRVARAVFFPFNEQIVFPAPSSDFSLALWYQSGSHVHLMPGFATHITRRLHEGIVLPTRFGVSHDLTSTRSSIRDIRDEFSNRPPFELREACTNFAQLLMRQPYGNEGELTIDTSWNLCFTGTKFTIGVRREANFRLWLVNAWTHDQHFYCDRGTRIFLPV